MEDTNRKIVHYLLGRRTQDPINGNGWEFLNDPNVPEDTNIYSDSPDKLRPQIPELATELGIPESDIKILKETLEEVD